MTVEITFGTIIKAWLLWTFGPMALVIITVIVLCLIVAILGKRP